MLAEFLAQLEDARWIHGRVEGKEESRRVQTRWPRALMHPICVAKRVLHLVSHWAYYKVQMGAAWAGVWSTRKITTTGKVVRTTITKLYRFAARRQSSFT